MRTALKIGLLSVLVLLLAANVFAGGGQEKAGKIKLVYLSKWNVGEVTQEIVNDAIESWVSDNPTVEVERLWSGRDVNAKLMAMIQGGESPDFYDEDPQLIEASLGKAGLALDLTPYLESVDAYDINKKVINTFSRGFFEPWTFRGEINTLPIQQYLNCFWYDKTMARKWGFTKTPDTWDEFIQTGEKIKNLGVAPIVLDGGIDFYNLYYFSHLTERHLGTTAFLDAVNDKTGKAWDNPGYLKAQQKVKELRDRNFFIDGFEGYQFPAGQIDWVQRKGAFILIHTYMPIEVADAKPDDFEYGSFPFPSVPGGKGSQYDLATVVGGVAILKSTKDPDLAFDMLKRLVSMETQTRMAQEALNVPTIVGPDLPDIFADLKQIMAKQTGTFLCVACGPGAFEPELAQTVVYPLNQEVIYGKLSPEDFIKQVKAKQIEYYKNK
ncbi:MAG: extracellular solute-binding protein [Spirochaetales bacterium]|nr:extracellular solute-binding protein [Spirochaetales bacterium]